ncbi:hypothetical protein ISN45_Aa01g011000 [Arabidopsis thaliana x Arabidopsis arenosa]|uniref:Non-specific serine/threonine protein kinase n=1 Tax=Arabidopsis thaliana x Arabidopsis arenosa TaxID=1240361 RepID=A0A8T2C521_9BRAS|nr:hypothetical protein ISN45_Aa01g011000 [Arabidopsis thaliana x Arabidopsis arenosa]
MAPASQNFNFFHRLSFFVFSLFSVVSPSFLPTIFGNFPFDSVCEIQKLEKLSLGFNSLSGIIPSDLKICTNEFVSSSAWFFI